MGTRRNSGVFWVVLGLKDYFFGVKRMKDSWGSVMPRRVGEKIRENNS